MDKIVETNIPDNYKRQNLVIGHTLYGAVSKKVNVLGEEILETEWEPVKKLPKGMIEIDNLKLRVYFEEEEGKMVEALEILKPTDSTESVGSKKKKQNASSEGKGKDTEQKKKKRDLPKIPSASDEE